MSLCLASFLFAAALAVDLPDQDPDPRFGQLIGVEVITSTIDPVTGIVYVGGDFNGWTRADNSTAVRGNLAAFDRDGNLLDWAPTTTGQVLGMHVHQGVLYIFGYFSHVNGVVRPRAAAVSATTGALLPFDASVVGTSVNDGVILDGRLYLAGRFSSIDGQMRDHLAAVDPVTGAVAAWNPGADNGALAIDVSGSTLYVVGWFGAVAGQVRGRGAAITTDGTLLDWNPRADGGENAGHIKDVVVMPAGIAVGGYFTTIGGTTRTRLALLHPTTGDDAGWDVPCDQAVLCLGGAEEGLYVGGIFDNVDGVPRSGLALVNPNGTLNAWTPTPFGGAYLAVAGTFGVYAGAGGFAAFTRPIPPRITAVTPDRLPVGTTLIELTITGTGFREDGSLPPSVHLSGPRAIVGTDVVWVNSHHLTCHVDLSDAPAGHYTITVTNPNGLSGAHAHALRLSGPPGRFFAPGSGSTAGSCGSGNAAALLLVFIFSLTRHQFVRSRRTGRIGRKR